LTNVKPITAQEKFNFPRANAILARAQALLWVRDWGLYSKREDPGNEVDPDYPLIPTDGTIQLKYNITCTKSIFETSASREKI
jgi:hypothetical protein